ncbi:unannotated protein [freshwater metagenome]|uniref:Unannotated protein n=1 Tax=freshwater metagenome TaxID=449393 RepID=A0A6J7G0U6_9ZZZZ|nr:hypothetical protein [Actinomycetota bacterium]
MSVSHVPLTPMRFQVPGRALPLLTAGASVVLAAAAAAPASAAEAPADLLVRPAPAGPPATTAWVSGREVFVAEDPAGVGAGRRVARLTRTVGAPEVSLSRDGRHLAVMGGEGVWSVPIAVGGPPTRLGDVPDDGAGGVRWAPDGRQLLLVDRSITHCVVEPQVRCRKAVTNGASAEFGASWSPDSATFAYTRARRDHDSTGVGDLVTRPVAAGPIRVIERATFDKRRVSFPTSAVWTRSGLAWTTYSGRNVADFEFRLSTRLQRPDGTVRTLAASPALAGKVLVPFLVSAETPSGRLLGQRITSPSRTIDDEASVSLRTLSALGRQAPYGVSYREGKRSAEILGVLADGRIAVQLPLDADGLRQALYLVTPGKAGLGTPVRTASAVSAAVAFPNDSRSF